MSLPSNEPMIVAAILILMNITSLVLMKTEISNRKTKIVISFLSLTIIALTSGNLYSHYSPESLHFVNHTFFKTAYILGLLILIKEDSIRIIHPLYNLLEVGFFDRFNYLFSRIGLAGAKSVSSFIEVGFFDRFNYLFSNIIVTISSILRRIQTGNLNINMAFILIFFLLGLIFIIL
jgi:hypothetical protein